MTEELKEAQASNTVKTAAEIEKIRAAQAITDAAFAHIIWFIKPDKTEKDVAEELDRFMLENGADEVSFPTIVAFGPHGVDWHHEPIEQPLFSGMQLVMDFGAKKDGYCSDMTRTIFLGETNPFYRYAYDALCAANEAVEAFLKPGVTGKEAHELAESILADRGFPNLMGHGLGHGVGALVHEEPRLHPDNDKPLEVGNVVTVEPGIYIPMGFELYAPKHGLNMSIPMPKFGMRLEDMGVITEDGFEVLTQSPHEEIIIE
jgi:Xaa-Pro aminopeptidase